MTDIVERLRTFDTRKMDAWGICDEAADEIERLREVLREIASIDYRGNAHPSASIARATLGEKE